MVILQPMFYVLFRKENYVKPKICTKLLFIECQAKNIPCEHGEASEYGIMYINLEGLQN